MVHLFNMNVFLGLLSQTFFLFLFLYRHMLLSASLWKPGLYYLLHVLLKTQFQMFVIFIPFNFWTWFVCVNVSLSVCSGFLIWLFEKNQPVCDSNCLPFMYCCYNMVVWLWSFCPACTYKPVLVITVCLLSWQIIAAFWSAEPTSLHDVTLP